MPTFGYNCCMCDRRTEKSKLRKVTDKNPDLLEYVKLTVKDLTNEEFICNKCRQKFYLKKRTNSLPFSDDNEPNVQTGPSNSKKPKSSPCNIRLPILSKSGNNTKCLFCNKKDRKLVSIPGPIRTQIFIEKGVLLATRSRCCKRHFNGDVLRPEILNDIEANSEEKYFNKSGIYDILENVRSIAKNAKNKRLDFDSNDGLSSEDYYALTGLTKEQFNILFSCLTSLRDSVIRSKRTALAIFLTKLRCGLSNRMLKTLFGINCRFNIQRAVSCCRTALMNDFVPDNIGFNHITREQVINERTRPLAQHLFSDNNDSVILVLDGTYVYIQKSSNYRFQRRSFSMHKNRPLVKPMMVVSTTGYIISVLGPYFSDSKNNDAAITKHIFETNSECINEWIKPEDIFVVDRGFRDSIEFLNNLGIQTEMPCFLGKKQKQHTTAEANTSRLVTKIRWIVESVNGQIKQWKILDNVVPNSQIPYIGQHIRIIGSICNKFRKDLVIGNSSDEALALRMLELSKMPNKLQERVEKDNLNRKSSKWVKMSATCMDDFPKMTEDQLRDLTLGVYQIKQAESYSSEHFSDTGDYDIQIANDITGLLRVRIQSRHVSSKQYNVYIEYDSSNVKAWYCQCKSGSRTVGMCAHVASVLWYLSFARYNSVPSKRNYGQYLEDAADLPVTDSSDSECSGESDTN